MALLAYWANLKAGCPACLVIEAKGFIPAPPNIDPAKHLLAGLVRFSQPRAPCRKAREAGRNGARVAFNNHGKGLCGLGHAKRPRSGGERYCRRWSVQFAGV